MIKPSVIQKAHNALEKVRQKFVNERMFLLRRAGETSRFTIVAEVLTGYWSRWSEYRQASVFMWASNTPEWNDRVATATHIGFGVPNENGQIDVFEIQETSNDQTPPSGGNLIWKAYGQRMPEQRFIIPTPPPDEEEEETP